MRRLSPSLALAAVSIGALLCAMSQASAGAFGIREQSASAQGFSFAGAASGSGGLSSIFWNPATITMAPGWQAESHFTLIVPEAEIHPVAPTPTLRFGPSGDIGLAAVAPASYGSYQLNDRLWVGVAVNAPFGQGTKPENDWAGQVYSRTTKVFSTAVNPILGIKVNDWLSVGAGPAFEYFEVLARHAGPPSLSPAARPLAVLPGAPNITVKGDDVGVGFTAGAMLTPFAGTDIGVGYRSSIHHDLNGIVKAPFLATEIGAELETPEMVTVGLTQRIGASFKLNLGFEWTNWSRLGTSHIVSAAHGVVGELPLEYRDAYMYSIGGEYQWSPHLALRAGVAYEESPIHIGNRSTSLPDSDRFWASLGASYRWNEKLSIDLAYSHLFFRKAPIAISAEPGANNDLFATAGVPFYADAEPSVDIVSVGFKYRWDTPAKPIPAAVVAKY